MGNPIRTTLITDGFGRLLQTKKDAEIGGQEVSLVTGKVVYDCFGRTVAQYHPFTEPLGTETVYNNTVTTGTGTLTAYDMMDRQTRVRQQPYGYETVMDYGFDWWNGKTLFRTETTDANGNVFTEMKGTLGQQLVQLPSTTNATELYYDALGRLTESMDAEGISTYYEYDRLGRMTHRTHPDAGEDWYSFDPAGNTVYRVSGNGDTVRYKYYFNLLTAISYPNNPANNVRYVYGSPSSPDNTAGKIILQEDASGWQTFKYGKLGEVIENIRTFALPNEPRPYTFKMKFRYDSWNRIDSMTYPDGEVVHYRYNKGGMLKNIQGNKNGDVRTYVKDIRYNKFELKESEIYGNGTQMDYEYDSLLHLSHLYSWDSHGDTMQSIGYTYDYVGNITDIANSAVTLPNGLGGSYYSHYDYDPLYRLTGAYGDWNNNQLSYNLGMQYYGNGKIWSKQLYADVLEQGNVTVKNYNNRYYYGSSTSNTVASVYDQTGHVWQSFSWDMAGNMVYHQDANGCGRTLCWDEENRLMSFADCENAGFYQYDAGGERTYKLTSDYVSQNIGGHWHTYQVLDNPTLYTSPYMVATPKGYTKHYYAESERVASRIGGGLDSVDMFIRNIEEFINKPMVEISPLWTDDYHEEFFDEKRDHNLDHLYHAMECTGNVPSVVYECLTILYKYSEYPHHEYEPDCYWYHPDHLGSSSWITFSDGKAVQHLHYLPWGEDFVNQRTSSFSSMYTFSAKEKDTETGYSYFGARYYSSDLSIWLSVDPMAGKYPSLSPYVYCADNPVKLVDPNGEEIDIDGFRYMPGQDCPEEASESTKNKWNSLNKIYSYENGKCIIDEMDQSTSCYSISSEKKTNGAGCYASNHDGTGGTIYLNGNDNNVGTLAHELFHGYQDMNGRDNHSIFNEIEANLFSFSITGTFQGLLIGSCDNQAERDYNENMFKLLYGTCLDNNAFDYINSNFTDCSPKNWRGTYNSYSTDTFSTYLISDFYPLYPKRLQ